MISVNSVNCGEVSSVFSVPSAISAESRLLPGLRRNPVQQKREHVARRLSRLHDQEPLSIGSDGCYLVCSRIWRIAGTLGSLAGAFLK